MKKYFLVVFFICSGMQLFAALTRNELVNTFSKPFIIPALIGYYVFSRGDRPLSLIFLIALVFSWAGDVLLMWEQYFLPGLMAFLVSHLGYSVTWRNHRHAETYNPLTGLQRLRMAFPVLLYGTGMVVVMMPHLDHLKVPVLLYAGVMAWMVLQALFRYGRTNTASFSYVLTGSVFFMLSDSLLAFNKFVRPVSLADFWIMLTYVAAQFLLVTGVLCHEPEMN